MPTSWMCKKQTLVSHSSTEAEIICRVIEVSHSSPNQTNKSGETCWQKQPNMRKQSPTMHTDLDLINVDHVLSSVTHSGSNAVLYVFEDNEAVIKMIIKGRSPMRQVSRNHSVALDWLFDRINLDFEIQIRYIDTKDSIH